MRVISASKTNQDKPDRHQDRVYKHSCDMPNVDEVFSINKTCNAAKDNQRSISYKILIRDTNRREA